MWILQVFDLGHVGTAAGCGRGVGDSSRADLHDTLGPDYDLESVEYAGTQGENLDKRLPTAGQADSGAASILPDILHVVPAPTGGPAHHDGRTCVGPARPSPSPTPSLCRRDRLAGSRAALRPTGSADICPSIRIRILRRNAPSVQLTTSCREAACRTKHGGNLCPESGPGFVVPAEENLGV
ncbi:hypothetical protein AXG93_2557s1010 [Marchantia polymorpha subsp. ruderalis]|uniref:Uncharacterized protein n=1 Tax=Marchantia polymorpha subsp. ruderalis TaxID=1480154 RepID=A0A176WRZ5_MARPO|nr:hypothetical protein AXG93_2557s1010 [Marchantia polymorpha subsp. ruderalis]